MMPTSSRAIPNALVIAFLNSGQACAAGRVAVNGMLEDQQAPFGGFKNSGVGREFGTYGIEAFLEPKAILE
jgi:acyl-CoA reductase-like NAD-dependent aldehyde dehydrogenase